MDIDVLMPEKIPIHIRDAQIECSEGQDPNYTAPFPVFLICTSIADAQQIKKQRNNDCKKDKIPECISVR